MIPVIVIPDLPNVTIEQMFELWNVNQCIKCLRFYFIMNENENHCNICDNRGDYTIVDYKKIYEKKNINNDEKDYVKKNKNLSESIKFIDVIKQNIKDKYPELQINISDAEFQIQKIICYMCGNSSVKQPIIDIFGNDKIITIKNLRFCCKMCNRMINQCQFNDSESIAAIATDLLFLKCESICNKYYKMKNTLFYNNVFSNNTCQLKYDSLKRIKKNNKYKFNITEKQYLDVISGDCYYCGRKSSDSNINDIVLLNNDDDYVETNCVTSCGDCKFLKGRIRHKEFIKHILDIYNYYKCQQELSQIYKLIINKSLRMYIYSHDNNGVATNIVFDNINISTGWTFTYYAKHCVSNSNNVFFKMHDIEYFYDGTIVEVETFKIDAGIHKLSYIGLSHSNNSTMVIPHCPIDNTKNIDNIIEKLQICQFVQQNNSDISFKIPDNKNCIRITISLINKKIIGIDFSFDNNENKYMICNCNNCVDHNKIKLCLCDECIKHKMHDHEIKCSCNPNNKIINNNTILELIGTSEQKKMFVRKHQLLELKNSTEQKIIIYDNIDKMNNVIQKKSQNNFIEKHGKDKFCEINRIKVQKSCQNKKEKLGIDQFNKIQNDKNKKHRKKRMLDNIPTTTHEKNLATSRKQKQRDTMKEKYGHDRYKKIIAIETQIQRAKKSNKTLEFINELVKQRDNLKNNEN